MYIVVVTFCLLLLGSAVNCQRNENATSITLQQGANCGGCTYNATVFIALGPHQSRLYSMDLSDFVMGHTDALEVEILHSTPDIQDTLLALNYKNAPTSMDYYDVVSDCGQDDMTKCAVGLCNPNRAVYYLLVENEDGNHVSMLANILIHKSNSMSCSVMPLYWVAVVAIFVAVTIVIAGLVVWFRRWYYRRKYGDVQETENERSSLTSQENKTFSDSNSNL